MTAWIHRIGTTILYAIEICLASLVLVSLIVLDEVATASPANEEAAGGFVVGFLGLWGFSAVLLVMFVFGHTGLIAYRRWIEGGRDAIRASLRRFSVEALAAGGIHLLVPLEADTTTFLVVTKLLALVVIIHALVELGGVARGVARL